MPGDILLDDCEALLVEYTWGGGRAAAFCVLRELT